MITVISLIVFITSYIIIISEKVDRTLVAGTGGVLLLLFGVFDTKKAFITYIDWNTIALLFAMMILVSIVSKTGVFEFIAIFLAQKVKGYGVSILFMISIVTALGSALLANVTTVLLLVPIMFKIIKVLNVSAFPYLIAIILSANIGGTATLIGDPPNLMIGQAVEHLTFNAFLVHLSPIAVIIFILIVVAIAATFRKRLQVSEENRLTLMSLNPKQYLKKDATLVPSLSVLGLTIFSFVLHPFLHIELTSLALGGAILLMLLTHTYHPTEEVLKEVDWATLFFFMGLFLLVGGLEEVGIIDEFARSMIYFTEGDLPRTAILILWITGLFSGVIDNIPFVAAMIPVILEFQDYGMTNLDPLWWSLALGACLGGNGTLLGASSNLVVVGLAIKEKVQIQFIDFMKIGIPVVLISLILSTLYIYFRYLLAFIPH
ncbi:ArsB/NhaD family transporter [Bacillus salitolerans]|uniref:ArsB/NhaD family transporter n=1 Tax=Bacillus salitolerans TaxID=1437434 RepID=A0ABW4LLL2_9BACI